MVVAVVVLEVPVHLAHLALKALKEQLEVFQLDLKVTEV
jgi:hypothetical protein